MKRTTFLLGALLMVISGLSVNRISANGLGDSTKELERAIVIERQIIGDDRLITGTYDENIVIVDGIIAKTITPNCGIDDIDCLIIG